MDKTLDGIAHLNQFILALGLKRFFISVLVILLQVIVQQEHLLDYGVQLLVDQFLYLIQRQQFNLLQLKMFE